MCSLSLLVGAQMNVALLDAWIMVAGTVKIRVPGKCVDDRCQPACSLGLLAAGKISAVGGCDVRGR